MEAINNPMLAQLAQWKANHQQGKINQFVGAMNASKNGSVKSSNKPQATPADARKPKAKGKDGYNPLFAEMSQLSRQFHLIQDSNQRCLDEFPDCFHHKLKMRDELTALLTRLKEGGRLLNALARAQGVTFTRDNRATLADFNQANGYLIIQFSELVAQIERLNIERVENQKLGVGNE